MKKYLFILIVAGLLISHVGNGKTMNHSLIEKQPVQVENGLMTPELLWQLGRLSGISVSPDNSRLLYQVQYFSLAQNKSNRDCFWVPIAGGKPTRITRTKINENHACWSPDGSEIYFLSDESGTFQLWSMSNRGRHRRQWSQIKAGIEPFPFRPTVASASSYHQFPTGSA
jgi:dipeptidyl aminopeptidase/acylaminoacyl peptidase